MPYSFTDVPTRGSYLHPTDCILGDITGVLQIRLNPTWVAPGTFTAHLGGTWVVSRDPDPSGGRCEGWRSLVSHDVVDHFQGVRRFTHPVLGFGDVDDGLFLA